MTLWKVAPVALEPEVSITRWRVLEVDGGSRHFIGADERDFSGRVSSAIVTFDCQARRGSTVSGRVYQLVGNPGRSGDADYVWQNWCAVNGVSSFADITERLLDECASDRLDSAHHDTQAP